ncbi:hypothetical protein [Methylobacterium dankookense]|uniref:Pectate lyase superfamily protein domain-containing protein n=1 Tax=Methylobacterium dankookense TaxID=560405 RepID=A0A564G6D1_9HYPH|nr:hypothetical protein [Methylobacterium dankookense]GJD58160.1 hypothetical protein IFDJLNFL_4075 [Methylobacterium dankookense]VUF15111.1 hypothetical protein MTDSW087_04844 [Methylobacterium dankookense]
MRRLTPQALALLALFGPHPVQALDIRSSAVAGRGSPAGNPLCADPKNIEFNRADRTLTICDPSNNPSVTTLLNALPAGRKAVEQGRAEDLTVTTGGVTEVLSSLQSRVVSYPTRAAATAARIPSTVTAVNLDGYAAAGDGGAARYAAVATQPVHQGKFQSADGRWWAIITRPLRPEMFGGFPGDGQDDLAAINAAMSVFQYQNTGGPSGGQIDLTGALYTVSGSIDTNGKHGLRILGGGMNVTEVRGTGNFSVFKDAGTSTTGTAEVELGNMKIRCSGKDNANAHGVQWNYSYNGKLHDLFVYACNHAIDLSNSWQVNMTRVRGDGVGADQSNIGLYMGVADPANPVINNAVNASDVVMNSQAQYNYRLINFQGSKFSGVEGGGAGLSNWYLCDPPTGNKPCQWGHFDNVLADTAPQYGFLLRQGNASEMSELFFGNMWTGNIYDAAAGIGLSIDGGQDIPISSLLAVRTVTAVALNNSARINIHGTIKNYNISNQSKPAISLASSVDNVFNVTTYTAQPVVGYNGYVEDANSYRNRVYGLGVAPCTLGLTFGGASTGITYAANGCSFEVVGTTVRAQFLTTLSSKGTATGVAQITGLPFLTRGGAPGYGATSPVPGITGMSGLTSVPIAQVQNGTKQAYLMQQGATGTANLADTNFTATSTLVGSLTYTKQ